MIDIILNMKLFRGIMLILGVIFIYMTLKRIK